MLVHVTARHCDVSDTIRRRAEVRLRRLLRYEHRLAAADAVFSTDHGRFRVELVLQVHREPTIVARGAGEDFRSALDHAYDRAARQIKRRRAVRRRRPSVRLSDLEPAAPGPG